MSEMTRQEQKKKNCWAIEDLYATDAGGKRILHRCPGRSKNLYSIRGNWETMERFFWQLFRKWIG